MLKQKIKFVFVLVLRIRRQLKRKNACDGKK